MAQAGAKATTGKPESAIATSAEQFRSQWPGQYILLLERDGEFVAVFHCKHFDEVSAWLEEWCSDTAGPPLIVIPPHVADHS